MFGGYSGRHRGESLDLLKAFLDAYGPPERALKSLRGPMSQAELAAQAGVSQPLVSDIEAGRKDLTPGVAGEIAGVLGLPPETLQMAVRLGRLKQMLAAEGPGDVGGPMLQQILEVWGLVEETLPEGALRSGLREVLVGSLTEAAERDRARLRALEAQEQAAAKQVATKSRKKKGPTRDQFGRRLKGAELLGLATKSRKEDGITRDAFGRNRSNRRPG